MATFVVVGLVWVGFAITGCTPSDVPGQTPGQAPARNQGPPPVMVELGSVETGELTDAWSFLGQVKPALSAELAAAVAGHVLAVEVREGDRVRKQQTLLSLDSAKIRAELAAAKAREQGLKTELEMAKRQLARVTNVEFPTISEPEREGFELDVARADTALATERAEIRQLQVELARHSIKAPFAGIVTARSVDPGAWLGAGQPVLSLVSLDDLEVHVDVSAELGSTLTVGQTVQLLGREPVPATIAGVVGVLDPSTRTMLVRLVPQASPQSAPPWLLPGMAVNVEFQVRLADRGVIVPRDAVVRGPLSDKVIAFKDGQGTAIEVDVLATAGAKALVRGEGLAVGSQVVIRGNERWRPGVPMKVRADHAGVPAGDG